MVETSDISINCPGASLVALGGRHLIGAQLEEDHSEEKVTFLRFRGDRTVMTPPTGPCRSRGSPPPRRRPSRSSAMSSCRPCQARVHRWLFPFEQE
ncbi:hypothetical protein DIZ27_00615 [Streptomyces sp. NWU339]|nr:hypothetical protein DIZ27_00615 [Streptomyces sp. NWU339]